MTPVGVQTRPGHLRTAARRRAGGPGRLAGESAPRLFPDGGEGPAPPERTVPAASSAHLPEAIEPRARGAGSVDGRGDGMTLEELIRGVWQEVLTEGRAACPLCGGELEGRVSAHARPTEGRCRDCGTTLA